MKSNFLFWMHIFVVKNHSICWAQSKRKRLSFCKPQVVKQERESQLLFPQRLSKFSMVPSYKIWDVVLFPSFKEIHNIVRVLWLKHFYTHTYLVFFLCPHGTECLRATASCIATHKVACKCCCVCMLWSRHSGCCSCLSTVTSKQHWCVP